MGSITSFGLSIGDTETDDEGLAEIAKCIEMLPLLTGFRFHSSSNQQITDEGLGLIVDLLSLKTNLTEFYFGLYDCTGVTNKTAVKVYTLIKESKTLTSIDITFTGTQATDDIFRKLKALENVRKFKKYDYSLSDKVRKD
eukprot:TRINITY_DN4547_c0_g1_i6.p1 TRINITY_DN4547_c0_g1~~TRINITY_DN4547_c0_g1_i6.p1  ORF type:complete len:140 (-),score=18.84 TRINITY_DN4547_c0_g1_i6:151-570(-)